MTAGMAEFHSRIIPAMGVCGNDEMERIKNYSRNGGVKWIFPIRAIPAIPAAGRAFPERRSMAVVSTVASSARAVISQSVPF